MRRIDELEFILHKNHRRNIVYEKLDKRLETLESLHKDFTFEISKRLETFEMQTNLYREKQAALEQHLDVSSTRLDETDSKILRYKNELNADLAFKIK